MTGTEMAVLNKLWEKLVYQRDSFQERCEVAASEPLRSLLQGHAAGYRDAIKLLDKALQELANG